MEKLSKVVVNKPYEVSFEFLVVLVCFFFSRRSSDIHFLLGTSFQLYNKKYSKI